MMHDIVFDLKSKGDMSSVFKIILGAPWYAWLALCYILFVGIQATRDRVVPLCKLFIMPAVLMALKYKLFTGANLHLLITYLISVCIGTLIGFLLAQRIAVKVLKTKNSIELKGEYVSLTILLAFFAAKYVCGYLQSTAPNLQVALSESVLTGIFSGGFLGRSLCFVQKFKLWK